MSKRAETIVIGVLMFLSLWGLMDIVGMVRDALVGR